MQLDTVKEEEKKEKKERERKQRGTPQCPCYIMQPWYCKREKQKSYLYSSVGGGYDCGVLHITDRACTHNFYVSGLG